MILRHFNRILIALICIIFLFISSLLFVAYREKEITEATFNEANQYHSTVDEAGRILSLINILQLESNSYVMTGDTAFLGKYLRARIKVRSSISVLSKILRRKYALQTQTDSLTAYVNNLINVSDKYIRLKQADNFNSEDFLRKILEGAEIRAASTTLIAILKRNSNASLRELRAANRQSYQSLNNISIVLIVAIVFYLLLAFLLIRHAFIRQRHAEKAIKEREKQFEDFFNLSPVPTSITDRDTGRFIYINEAYEKLVGYSKSETFSKSVVELKIIDLEKRKEILGYIAGDDLHKHAEIQLNAKGGTVKEVYASFDLIEVDSMSCILACMIDITERKLSEEKLKKSEERFSVIMNLSPVPKCISEVDSGKLVFINNSFAALIEKTPAEIIGKTITDLNIIDVPSRKLLVAEIEKNNGKINNLEIKVNFNGQIKDVILSTELVDLDGRRCYLTTLFDISDRKKFEARIKQSEKKFSAITRLNPIPTVITDNDGGKVVYANEAFSALLEKEISDIIGKKLVELNLLNEEYYQLITTITARNDGRLKNHEIKMNVRNEIKDFLLSSELIDLDNRKCSLVTILDISERKKSENAMNEAYLKERELSSMKSNFVSIASHEFRTPLTTILSSAALLEMYNTTEQHADRIRHIERIKNSSSNLTMILEELLSLDKIETGRIGPEVTSFNISEFTGRLCQELKYAAKRGQTLTYRHIGETEIHNDRSIIRHIITNLISNGFKYSPENSEVKVITSFNGDKLVIKVCDNGIGISEEDRKYLFKRFYRASNAGNIQGTGLGLHIVKKYVDMLNGSITVKSEINKGSEFTILL